VRYTARAPDDPLPSPEGGPFGRSDLATRAEELRGPPRQAKRLRPRGERSEAFLGFMVPAMTDRAEPGHIRVEAFEGEPGGVVIASWLLRTIDEVPPTFQVLGRRYRTISTAIRFPQTDGRAVYRVRVEAIGD
jgi:hypothetical protein